MLPGVADLPARLEHVGGLIFTAWTVLGLIVAGVCWLAARGEAREPVIVCLGLVLMAWFTSLTLAAVLVAHALACYAAVEARPRPLGVALLVGLLAAMVIVPVEMVGPLGSFGPHARAFIAFSTNMVLLRLYGYAWDRWQGRIARPTVLRFVFAQFFFPTFINGPIEVLRQMEDGRVPMSSRDALAGLARVALGVAKLLAVGLALPPGWTSGLTAMTAAPAWQLWLWGALLYVWFFLSFSAWTDVAVGLGRLCGRRVQENFFAPWRAVDPADFWRRWHVSLGLWLRDYVYIPLGGNRRWRVRNVLVVFVVSAAWHVWGSAKLLGLGYFPPRAWVGLFVWGALNAAGVLAAPALDRILPAKARAGITVRCVATFLFAAFCWVPFFFPGDLPLGTGLRLLARMLWPFGA